MHDACVWCIYTTHNMLILSSYKFRIFNAKVIKDIHNIGERDTLQQLANLIFLWNSTRCNTLQHIEYQYLHEYFYRPLNEKCLVLTWYNTTTLVPQQHNIFWFFYFMIMFLFSKTKQSIIFRYNSNLKTNILLDRFK